MRIIGVVPGAKLFGSEDLYADQYLFVNGYPKRILANGAVPVGILSSDGYAAEESLSLCDDLYSAAGHGFIRTIFRSWSMLPNPESPCSASALGCR